MIIENGLIPGSTETNVPCSKEKKKEREKEKNFFARNKVEIIIGTLFVIFIVACLTLDFILTEKYNLKLYWLIPYVFFGIFIYIAEISFTINGCPPIDFPRDPNFKGDEFEIDPVENKAQWSFARKHFAISFSLLNLIFTLILFIGGPKTTNLNSFYLVIVFFFIIFRIMSLSAIPLYLGLKKCYKYFKDS